MNKITVGMPVKAYLKKYVYWKENLSEEDVLDLSCDSEIRMVLNALFTGKFAVQQRGACSDTLPKHFSDEIICKLTPERISRNLFFLTLDHVRFFNTYLYKVFHDDLLYMILLNKEHGIHENATIQTFIESVEIDYLISFDALKKASYRLRKTRNLPIFRIVDRKSAVNPYEYRVQEDFLQK